RGGRNLRETAHDHAGSRENEGGIDVARIELDGVAQSCDRLVPMSKPSLDQGDRPDDINVIRQTLLVSLEFRQCPGEIALPVKAVITKSQMSFRQIWIKCERPINGILGGCQARRARIEP